MPDEQPLPYDAIAASHALAAAHPAMAAVVAAVGPPTLAVRPDETFPALVRAVVYQQLSGRAAATIHGRLVERLGGAMAPDAVHALADDDLRACGLSRAKLAAVRDLADRAGDGRLPDRAALAAMPDDAAIAALTAARGVGVWTAQMLLLFTLGRPDVWPTADLGVQEGWRLATSAAVRPTPRELAAAGEPLRPWRSLAAWYLWREVDRLRGG